MCSGPPALRATLCLPARRGRASAKSTCSAPRMQPPKQECRAAPSGRCVAQDLQLLEQTPQARHSPGRQRRHAREKRSEQKDSGRNVSSCGRLSSTSCVTRSGPGWKWSALRVTRGCCAGKGGGLSSAGAGLEGIAEPGGASSMPSPAAWCRPTKAWHSAAQRSAAQFKNSHDARGAPQHVADHPGSELLPPLQGLLAEGATGGRTAFPLSFNDNGRRGGTTRETLGVTGSTAAG